MEINGLNLHNLQNGEHYEFMNETNKLIQRFTAEAIDAEALYPAFEAAFADEDRSFQIIQKSDKTRTVESADKTRDITLSGFNAQVKASLNHYEAASAEAAYRLKVLVDGYGNLQSMSYDKQTAGIVNLLQELQGKYAADVQLLNLTGYVARIEADNTAFINIMQERYTEQSEKAALTRLRTARLATDAAYNAIRNRINAGIIFNGDGKYEAFVLEMNTRVARFKNAVAQRKGRTS